MDPPHAYNILPTNATSAANPLANTTPTAIALDTVIQTNLEGEPLEYREIKTTETILQPTPLEYAPPPDMTTETKITTVREVPKVSIPSTKTTTTVVEETSAPTDYVIKSAGAFKLDPSVKQVVETTVTEPTTKVIKTIETTK